MAIVSGSVPARVVKDLYAPRLPSPVPGRRNVFKTAASRSTSAATSSWLFPGEPLKFVVLGGGDIVASYGPDRFISVRRMSAAGAGLAEREGAGAKRPGTLSYADIPRILFTKTPKDAEPKNPEDRRFWRTALISKDHVFADATEMLVAERGPMTLYLADAKAAGTTGFAYVVHRATKDWFLFRPAGGV